MEKSALGKEMKKTTQNTLDVETNCRNKLINTKPQLTTGCANTDRQIKKDVCGYLKHIYGDGNDDIKQVSECQAANQDIGSIPHTLVLVYDPEERWVADDPHHKDQAGHDRVHILEGVLDLCGLYAHGGEGAPRPGWL